MFLFHFFFLSFGSKLLEGQKGLDMSCQQLLLLFVRPQTEALLAEVVAVATFDDDLVRPPVNRQLAESVEEPLLLNHGLSSMLQNFFICYRRGRNIS